MISVNVTLSARGRTFSPKKAGAELGIDLTLKGHEPRALGSTGKYKGRPVPWGKANLELPWPPVGVECSGSPDEFDTLTQLPASLNLLRSLEVVPTLRRFGATDIILWVIVEYRDQCNMELSPALLAALAGLGVPVAISCYLMDGEDG